MAFGFPLLLLLLLCGVIDHVDTNVITILVVNLPPSRPWMLQKRGKGRHLAEQALHHCKESRNTRGPPTQMDWIYAKRKGRRNQIETRARLYLLQALMAQTWSMIDYKQSVTLSR